jgi:hypothetical protein
MESLVHLPGWGKHLICAGNRKSNEIQKKKQGEVSGQRSAVGGQQSAVSGQQSAVVGR